MNQLPHSLNVLNPAPTDYRLTIKAENITRSYITEYRFILLLTAR